MRPSGCDPNASFGVIVRIYGLIGLLQRHADNFACHFSSLFKGQQLPLRLEYGNELERMEMTRVTRCPPGRDRGTKHNQAASVIVKGAHQCGCNAKRKRGRLVVADDVIKRSTLVLVIKRDSADRLRTHMARQMIQGWNIRQKVGCYCRRDQASMSEQETAVYPGSLSRFRQSPLERLPCLLSIDRALDAGKPQQSSNANTRFGSLGLLLGRRQVFIRHNCSHPTGLALD